MLSENIRELRKQKGYSQETFAQALNVVRQTVSKWEKGYSVPDAVMLEKMADVLDVSVGDLLGKGDGTPDRKDDLEKISAQLAVLNEQMAKELGRRRKNRKILLAVLASAAALVFLAGCASLLSTPFIAELFSRKQFPAGDASQTETVPAGSALYSEKEIADAVGAVIRDFERDWNGCRLTKIWYAGDEVSRRESEERGTDVIVLRSTFETAEVPDESGMSDYTTYDNWGWILIRTPSGSWKHVDHGYG